MSVAAAPPERFDIGRVLAAGFGLFTRRAVPVLGLAIVFGLLPAIGIGWATSLDAPRPGAIPDLAATFSRLGRLQAVGVVVGGFSFLQRGGVAVIATLDAAGRGDEIGAQLTRELARAPIVFLAGVAASLGIALGALLFIVPGVLLSLAWAMAPAAGAVEGKGFLDMFRRSAELTRGSRGALFVIALIFGVAAIALSFLLRLAIGMPMLAPTGSPLFSLVLQPILSALFAAILSCIYAAAYLELHGVKDGVAAVFD